VLISIYLLHSPSPLWREGWGEGIKLIPFNPLSPWGEGWGEGELFNLHLISGRIYLYMSNNGASFLDANKNSRLHVL